MIAAHIEDALQKLEMDRRHLRAEDGVILSHLLREDHAFQSRGTDLPFFLLLFLLPDGGEKGAYADPCRAQVIDLVDLQTGIDLVGAGEDIVHLIGGHGVQAAAEGIELDQVQIVSCAHEGGRRIQSGMVHPLIGYDERTVHAAQMRHGILGEHGKPVGGDQLRNAVVDLRVQVIGPARKDDALLMVVLQPGKDLLALSFDILMGSGHFFPAGRRGPADLLRGKLLKFFDQGVRGDLQAGERHEGIAQHRLAPADLLHIVLDVFRIGGDDGAVVMIVRALRFVPFIKQSGIEDEIHVLFNQPGHMPVGQLGRIAFRFAGNGLDAQLINGMGGAGGEHHLIAQPGKKGIPERIVFIHVQHSGNTHPASPGLVGGQRLVGEQPFQLVFKQVRHLAGILRFSQSPFAAVAGDVLAAAGKPVDGEPAVIGAAPALCHAGLKFQGIDLIDGQHGGLIARGIVVPGDQGRAESAHDAGDVRADRLAAGDLFKASQDRVVVEGAALHHDLASQLGGVGHLDDLEQRVLDDGIGKAGGNVGNLGPFLLRLLHLGIHENRAAGSQIDGMLCEQGRLREILHAVIQGLRKGLDEGAAAGGAGLV